jgi:hypothetical protein
MVALGLVAFLVQRAVSNGSSAPYSADAVHARVSMQLVTGAQVQATLDQLAGPGRLSAALPTWNGPWARHVMVGELQFDTPKNAPADGQYALFVIDNDEHRPVPGMWGVGPVGTNVAQGWDSAYDRVAAKYDWLRPLAEIPEPGTGITNPGSAVSFAPNTRAPVTFEVMFPRASLPITQPSRQLTVALVFIGGDGNIYWATRLPL